MSTVKKRFTIQTYNIGIVGADVIDSGNLHGEIKWLKHCYNDRFFADPFLWYRDHEFYYILVEEFCFFDEYGRIALLKVDKQDFSLVSRETIIQEPYHLSFPFCIEGDEHIIPESVGGNVCKIYHVSKESHTIISSSVLFDDGIIDPILFSHNGVNYILGGEKNNPSGELYMFIKNEKTEKYICSHEVSNPIVKDRGHARNAGGIFIYMDKLIRPTQDCTKRYGYAIRLMEIKRMDKSEYKEVAYLSLNGGGNPPFDETLHTFNYYGEFALLDGSKDVFAMRNIFFKVKKYLNRLRNKL